MKKICFITTISTTLESFVLPVANYISQNTDWKIYMVCDKDSEFQSKLSSNINYIPVTMKRGVSLSAIRSIIQLKQIFRCEKFDLIQYSTPNASLYASLAGKITKTPVRLYCQWGMAYVGMSGIKRMIFKMLEKVICSMSTWIEPDSRSNLKFAHSEKLYKEEKGSVVGNGSACGVKFEKFDVSLKEEYRRQMREMFGIPERAFVFGFVGRITRDKGINELLLASRRILEEYPNTFFLILGAEEGIHTLNAEMYEWSRGCKNFIYTGNVDNVEQYLSAMDCYVLPSYREGFGMSTIEAEAMEVPVVVTDIPGPIDAMQENITGKIVKKADWKSLYDGMIEMYKMDDVKRLAMGKAGRSFVLDNFKQEELFKLILQDRKKLLGEL